MAVMQQPFPDEWERILRAHVAFFEALDDAGKARFRHLVQIFLDEVRITGIRTEVDETAAGGGECGDSYLRVPRLGIPSAT
jgi:Mlc titration factor MtfA (ptsG expression regulator)